MYKVVLLDNVEQNKGKLLRYITKNVKECAHGIITYLIYIYIYM